MNDNMHGLNGISIQRKNGKGCDVPLVPREEPPPKKDNPLELLQKLSGSGILIDKRPSKPNTESPDQDISNSDLNVKASSNQVTSEDVQENKIGSSSTAMTRDLTPPTETPAMEVVEPSGIDILKKLLDAVPEKRVEGSLNHLKVYMNFYLIFLQLTTV